MRLQWRNPGAVDEPYQIPTIGRKEPLEAVSREWCDH